MLGKYYFPIYDGITNYKNKSLYFVPTSLIGPHIHTTAKSLLGWSGALEKEAQRVACGGMNLLNLKSSVRCGLIKIAGVIYFMFIGGDNEYILIIYVIKKQLLKNKASHLKFI